MGIRTEHDPALGQRRGVERLMANKTKSTGPLRRQAHHDRGTDVLVAGSGESYNHDPGLLAVFVALFGGFDPQKVHRGVRPVARSIAVPSSGVFRR